MNGAIEERARLDQDLFVCFNSLKNSLLARDFNLEDLALADDQVQSLSLDL